MSSGEWVCSYRTVKVLVGCLSTIFIHVSDNFCWHSGNKQSLNFICNSFPFFFHTTFTVCCTKTPACPHFTILTTILLVTVSLKRCFRTKSNLQTSLYLLIFGNNSFNMERKKWFYIFWNCNVYKCQSQVSLFTFPLLEQNGKPGCRLIFKLGHNYKTSIFSHQCLCMWASRQIATWRIKT